MDKSFVNIDDLVRQRLSGGEEHERAGAWMRMRELLDNEEDRKPVGFIFWRRMLGAMAVLLMLATITVGSYEYVAFRNAGADNSSNGLAANAGSAAKHTVPATHATTSKDATATHAIAANNTATTASVDNNNNNSDASSNNGTSEAATVVVNHNTAAHHTSAHHKTTNNNKLTAPSTNNTIANNNGDNQPDNKTALTVAATTNSKQTAVNGKTADHLLAANIDKAAAARMAEGKTDAATVIGNTTSSVDAKNDKAAHLALNSSATVPANNAVPATSATRTTNTTTSGSEDPAVVNTDITATGLKKDAHKTAAKTSKTKQAKAPAATTAATTEKAAKATATNSKEVAGTAKGSKATKETKAANTTTTDKKVADNTTVSVDKTSAATASVATEKKINTTVAKHNEKKAVATTATEKAAHTSKAAKMKATFASTTSAATNTGEEADNDDDAVAAKEAARTKTAAKTNSTTVSKLALGSSVSATKTSVAVTKPVVKAKTTADKTTADKAGNSNTVSASVATTAKAPKTAKASAKQPSKPATAEKADMDKDADKAVAKNSNAPKARRTIQKIVTTEHYVKTSSTGGYYRLDTVSLESVTEEFDLLQFCAQTPFVLPKSDASAIAAKKVSSSNDNSGTMKKTLDNTPLADLANAFNDMKYKVGAVQFAPGLIAGINGTFFGPNSFKGFQFGITGSLIVKENFSLNGELKYFHRINNEYQLDDNFYTYTPVAGGYKKELELNWYSFSTLHSFELPVYVAYGAGNFNLFAGPNFVYTMAINTGAAQLKDPNYVSATYTAIGNDNTPKLNNDDFGTRFGIGYLVGISYRMAPNMTLDFRTVQTMWDNAKSTGSKTVSSELYKSPSLQVSFGYRLGNKK